VTTGGQERSDRGIGVEDDLDDLYGVAPAEFMARRKELVAAAKKRGDADGVKLIGAARRPTTAAWVVNALVRADGTAKSRLNELSEHLRAAHAAMDGAKIRELSAVQRKLIDGLVRAGFAAAEVTRPSAALRDDVVGTLQAAVADPEVAARLGRLEKAERWSGFGEFGTVTAVGLAPKSKPKSKSQPKSKPEEPHPSVDREAELAAARERRSTAASAAKAARADHSDAVEHVSERKAKLAKARRQYEKLLESVDAAEQALNAADEQFNAAELTARNAAERLDAATSEFELAEAGLAQMSDK
jgi:hypothetical protein